MVLRIRDDRGLVLRYLHHGQTLKVDHGVRHCRFRGASSEREMLSKKNSTAYIHASRCRNVPTSCGTGNPDSDPVS
jgi:hypothetical protein